jgi:hypothetical protein
LAQLELATSKKMAHFFLKKECCKPILKQKKVAFGPGLKLMTSKKRHAFFLKKACRFGPFLLGDIQHDLNHHAASLHLNFDSVR